jgi:enolase-phosphatase E1
MIKLYLFDIEGTTTDIDFVHQVLFPYSSKHLQSFVQTHVDHPIVAQAIEEVKKTVEKEEGLQIGLVEVIQKLLSWINIDRKHGALKEIQGLIWDAGYSKNDFKGHVYQDVQPFFNKILTTTQSKIGIYSSGSVHAQKLIFGYSVAGDLTPYISYYFDTKIGGKRSSTSYSSIAKQLALNAKEIFFFSDIPEELAAASQAGCRVVQVLRPGTTASNFQSIESFSEITL